MNTDHQVNAFAAPQHTHAEGFDPDSLGYGLPYECCASNSEQGWPRYTQLGIAMRAAPPARGLLLTGYASATVTSGDVTVDIVSHYPFDDVTPIQLRMVSGQAAWVDLRVPVWAVGATLLEVACNASSGSSETKAPVALQNGTEYRVSLAAGADICAKLDLPMSLRIERRLHGAVAIYRGPLLFSLPLNYSASVIDAYSPPRGIDESLTLAPGATWRWALVLKNGLSTQLTFSRRSNTVPVDAPPWSEVAARARGTIHMKARPVPEPLWPAIACSTNFAHYNDSCAGAAPQSPVVGLVGAAIGVELIPIGAADVQLAELPYSTE